MCAYLISNVNIYYFFMVVSDFKLKALLFYFKYFDIINPFIRQTFIRFPKINIFTTTNTCNPFKIFDY